MKKKNKEIKKELFRGKCQKEILSSYVIGEPLTAWLTLMIKKRVIDRLDYPFDKSLHICSDFDLIIRLSGSCYFDFLEDYLCYYRLHPNNESKKQELEIEELSYIVTKFNNDANISNIMNLNNFSDKILIKNYINQNILEKKKYSKL